MLNSKVDTLWRRFLGYGMLGRGGGKPYGSPIQTASGLSKHLAGNKDISNMELPSDMSFFSFRFQETYGSCDLEAESVEGSGWFTEDPTEISARCHYFWAKEFFLKKSGVIIVIINFILLA